MAGSTGSALVTSAPRPRGLVHTRVHLRSIFASRSVLTDTTVIGFFRSDNQGGITVRNAVIRTAPVVTTSGLVGDKNNEFENQQGQFIVQNTIVTNASTYGIRIDAGRVGDGSQSPDLGVAQNRAVLNNAGLVPVRL